MIPCTVKADNSPCVVRALVIDHVLIMEHIGSHGTDTEGYRSGNTDGAAKRDECVAEAFTYGDLPSKESCRIILIYHCTIVYLNKVISKVSNDICVDGV